MDGALAAHGDVRGPKVGISLYPLHADPLPSGPHTQPLPEAITAVDTDLLRPGEASHDLNFLAQVIADLHDLDMDRLVVTQCGNLHATRAHNQRRGRQPE